MPPHHKCLICNYVRKLRMTFRTTFRITFRMTNMMTPASRCGVWSTLFVTILFKPRLHRLSIFMQFIDSGLATAWAICITESKSHSQRTDWICSRHWKKSIFNEVLPCVPPSTYSLLSIILVMPGTAANIRREDQRKNVIVKQLNFLQLCTSMLFSASFIDVEIHRPIKLAQMTEVRGAIIELLQSSHFINCSICFSICLNYH